MDWGLGLGMTKAAEQGRKSKRDLLAFSPLSLIADVGECQRKEKQTWGKMSRWPRGYCIITC